MSTSYQSLLGKACQQLQTASDTPRIDAERLLAHASGKNLAWLIAHAEQSATIHQQNQLSQLVERRIKGEPIAYLVGYRDFWSLRLKVNPYVLIPRPDTETLVEQALDVIPQQQTVTVADLGTGSGAIALSIAKERPKARVLATDNSKAALQIAAENAAKYQLDNVRFLQSDWFDQIDHTRFEVILSNPPYVAHNDPRLKQADLRFEPPGALGSGADGLESITTIIDSASNHLKSQGWLFIEHGFNQQQPVSDLFKENGFCNVHCFVDLNQLPRCTSGQWLAG